MAEYVIPYSPRSVFRQFHGRTERWACIVAHRRCGKTVACINDLIRRAFVDGKKDGRYAYIAPFHNQAKSVAWDYLLKYSEPVRRQSNASELWVELINGARIRLFGADLPDALRGLYMDGVILDEYADMKPRVWGEIIRPLLSDRAGWAVFIGTPKGHNAFYDIHRAAQAQKDWLALTLRASDTKLLPAGELEDARRGMTEEQYEQEFECSFEAAILGAVLGRYVERAIKQGRVNDDVAYDPDGAPIEISSDIGRRDTAAWWFWQPKIGGYSLVDYDEGNGQDATEWCARLAQRVKDKDYRLGKIWLPHDAKSKTFAAQHSAQEQFWDYFGIVKIGIVPDTTKSDRINAARTVIDRCEFALTECNDGLEALKAWVFEWDEERKEFSAEPRHDWASHPGDAYSYGALIMRERTLAPVPEPTLYPQHRTINQLIAHQRQKRLQGA